MLHIILTAGWPVLGQNTVPHPPAWLEPVSFPASGHNICSPDSWKLVFVDHFTGNTIDTTKWITYKSWKGLQRPAEDGRVNWDHDDWGGSRHEGGDEKNIFRDENIVVSNGTAKLKIKHEPYSWKCPSCPESERQHVKYTGAALCTYYYYKGQQRSFNSGRFEFRARFPDFPHSFGTAWTWAGEHMGVNELDLAESNGANWSGNPKKDWLRGMNWKNYVGRIYHPTHAWGRLSDEKRNLPPYPVPFHNLKDVRREDNPAHFPGQNWSDFITGTMFDFTQWNTYTIEWDSTEVRTYLNHVLVDRLPKYYYKKRTGTFSVRVNPGCNADTTYQVTRGFPYSINSGSQLRFTVGVKNDVQMDNSNEVYDLGEIELDYVAMWQRQPEPGYQEISTDTILRSPPDNNQFGNVRDTANRNADRAATTYSGPKTARYSPMVMCSRQSYPIKSDFIFKVLNPLPGVNYSWEVWYSVPGAGEHHYQGSGTTIITPKIVQGFQPGYLVKWKLKANHNDIVKEYKGMRDMRRYTPINYSQPLSYMAKDKSITYLEARFSETDSIAYETEVRELVATKYIDDPADTGLISALINDAYFERLEKYLYFSESENNYKEPESLSAGVDMPSIDLRITKSFVHLNPEQKDLCQVILSSLFDQKDAGPVRYRIMDLNQTILFTDNLDREQQNINLKHLQDNGVYVLELKQNDLLEYIRLQR